MSDDGKQVHVLRYFHGGRFQTNPRFEYVNGAIENFQVDPDKLCLWDILDNVELLGYGQHQFIYYRIPNLEFNCDGLVFIHNDVTVREVIELLRTKGTVDIYIDHKIDDGDGNSKTNDDCKKVDEVAERIKIRTCEDTKGGTNVEGTIGSLEIAGDELRAAIELGANIKGLKAVGDELTIATESGADIEDLEYVGDELRDVIELGVDIDGLEAAGDELRAVIEELNANVVFGLDGGSKHASDGFELVVDEELGLAIEEENDEDCFYLMSK
ncbi:hypothetical protein HRI_004270000 [Hibiscus trionum]|uniref:PB1-like domain-containing protein n=1 Tax=Hibiscus trionum TaxID=183268 RepID=A0A9W7MIR4_HIBTR|nr:hypothetical protein HRI_004270000 [Hibiscus trionum]